MADDTTGPGGRDADPDDHAPDPRIVRRTIPPNPATAEFDFLSIVAELEGKEIDELPSLYSELDHFVESLFERPPSPTAQMQLRFSYAGYRVTIDQEGQVTLVPVRESIPEL